MRNSDVSFESAAPVMTGNKIGIERETPVENERERERDKRKIDRPVRMYTPVT